MIEKHSALDDDSTAARISALDDDSTAARISALDDDSTAARISALDASHEIAGRSDGPGSLLVPIEDLAPLSY